MLLDLHRLLQTPLDGIWASTPLYGVPFTPQTDGWPTEPAQPFLVPEDKVDNEKRVASDAARRSSLMGGAGGSVPARPPPQAIFKRVDGADISHRFAPRQSHCNLPLVEDKP